MNSTSIRSNAFPRVVRKISAFSLGYGSVFITVAVVFLAQSTLASECQNLGMPAGTVIWCDSFEDADLPPSGNLADNYFDFDDDQGDHVRVATESFDGQYSLRQRWQSGEVDAGHLFRNFGRNPVMSQSHPNSDFREIYWRMYVKYAAGFQGIPAKLTRATVFANSNWAQAMIGHVWADDNNPQFLAIDPASGTDSAGVLQTTQWNDFNNLTWPGLRRSSVPFQINQWQCIESRIALNSPGASDGKFTLWVDDELAAERDDLNWLGSYSDYGINAVMISAHWNSGSPAELARYIDSFVIATTRIGCNTGVKPNAPSNLTIN